jgi:hypothetical protein
VGLYELKSYELECKLAKAPGFNPEPIKLKNWFQSLLSNSTCAATPRGAVLVSKYNRGKWGQYFVRLQPDEGGDAKNLRVFFHREVAPWGHKSDSTVPTGYFSHIGVTYAKGYSSIYINGSLSGSQKEGAQDNNPETTVMLGAMLEKGAPIDFFSGVIDEVRLYKLNAVDP